MALITGASSGVGWATAIRLAGEGMRVCVTGRREQALEELKREIEKRGGACLAVAGDVTRDDDVARVVARCVEHFGRIDLLVNNAAVHEYATFESARWDEIQRVFEVNVFGYFRFTRAVLPHFHAQCGGAIINVLSILSKGVMPLFSLYTATKHALLGWSETLRHELRTSPISVSAVLMPALATPLYDNCASKLPVHMRPPPPIYSPDFAARAIVRCAKLPRSTYMPSKLQGHVLFWAVKAFPRESDFVLNHFARKLQETDELRAPTEGNLFEPVDAQGKPRGELEPTPGWIRWSIGAGLTALAGAAAAKTWHALRS